MKQPSVEPPQGSRRLAGRSAWAPARVTAVDDRRAQRRHDSAGRDRRGRECRRPRSSRRFAAAGRPAGAVRRRNRPQSSAIPAAGPGCTSPFLSPHLPAASHRKSIGRRVTKPWQAGRRRVKLVLRDQHRLLPPRPESPDVEHPVVPALLGRRSVDRCPDRRLPGVRPTAVDLGHGRHTRPAGQAVAGPGERRHPRPVLRRRPAVPARNPGPGRRPVGPVRVVGHAPGHGRPVPGHGPARRGGVRRRLAGVRPDARPGCRRQGRQAAHARHARPGPAVG